MADEVEYHMHRSGATNGSVSGRLIRYDAGEVLRAPKGELMHLPDSAYETRPVEPTSSTSSAVSGQGDGPTQTTESRRPWSIGDHKGAGHYYLLYEGDRVEKQGGDPALAGRGEENAKAKARRLNDEGVTLDDYLSSN